MEVESASPYSFHAVNPIVSVRELEPAVDYYTDKLGFQLLWRWGEPAIRAGVGLDGIEFQLVESNRVPENESILAYVHMRGIEAYYRGCVDRGASISDALETRPWGMRDFRVLDPSGNRIGFGEPT